MSSMHRRSFVPIFLLLIFLSAIFFGLSKTNILKGPADALQSIFSPFEKSTFNVFNVFKKSENSKISLENRNLVKKLVDQKKLQDENTALRFQFETEYPKSQSLLPATVVGAPSFIPGVSTPSYLILDKGTADNVKVGSAVVVTDNVVGKVVETSSNFSKVVLITADSSSFSASVVSVSSPSARAPLGVVKGLGSEMLLDNVLLSENLKIGDYVVTKGDLDLSGRGFAPNLIVGKITSVEKKPSALFQKGKVKSLLDFSNLQTVFVFLGE